MARNINISFKMIFFSYKEKTQFLKTKTVKLN